MFNQSAKFVLTLGVALILGAGTAFAADCDDAIVTDVILHSATPCASGSYAFTTDQSGSWICVETITGVGYTTGLHTAEDIAELNKLVLAAFLSGRHISYAIRGRSGCTPSGSWVLGESIELLYVSHD